MSRVGSTKLGLQLRQVSAAVVAHDHNPSILNPDFLRANNIVPHSWERTETFTTPAVSRVVYPNGVSLLVEPNKLLVQEDVLPDAEPAHAMTIVSKFARALPKVPYAAMGLNLRVVMPRSEPAAWIRGAFLREAEWTLTGPELVRVSLGLTFSAEEAVCNISVQQAESKDGEKSRPVVVFAGNFHFDDVTDADAIERIAATFAARQKFFVELVENIASAAS